MKYKIIAHHTGMMERLDLEKEVNEMYESGWLLKETVSTRFKGGLLDLYSTDEASALIFIYEKANG